MNENTSFLCEEHHVWIWTFELLKSEKALAASDVIVQRHISFGTGSEIMHDLFLLGLQRTGHRRGIKYMIKINYWSWGESTELLHRLAHRKQVPLPRITCCQVISLLVAQLLVLVLELLHKAANLLGHPQNRLQTPGTYIIKLNVYTSVV